MKGPIGLHSKIQYSHYIFRYVFISEDKKAFYEVARLLEAAPGNLVAGETKEQSEGPSDGCHDSVEVVDEKLLFDSHLGFAVIHCNGARVPDPTAQLLLLEPKNVD